VGGGVGKRRGAGGLSAYYLLYVLIKSNVGLYVSVWVSCLSQVYVYELFERIHKQAFLFPM
jgi:hypothetical protein